MLDNYAKTNKAENDMSNEINREKKSWESNYKSFDYDNVFNLTKESGNCKKISESLADNVANVLIPGCGSQTYLQSFIEKQHPSIDNIYCTDWSEEAIAIAKTKNVSDHIRYQVQDSTNLNFQDSIFDAVLICNSILSESDEANKKMLGECSRVLKKDGLLTGFFPTIFSALDISISNSAFESWQHDGTINLKENKIYEKQQSLAQILYTPLGLRRRLNDCGFNIIEMSVCFFESSLMLEESEKIYNIPTAINLPVWELFIKALKKS